MARLTEAEPARGVALPEAAGIVRVVAPNPGPMTYHGTNSWVVAPVGGAGGATVIDPGPDDPGHLAAVLAAAGTIGCILVSHSHRDHFAGAASLRAASGARVLAHRSFAGAGAAGGDAAGAGVAGGGETGGGETGAGEAGAGETRAGAAGAGAAGAGAAGLEPDGWIEDGDVVGGLLAVHTPGHAADHLCFAREDGVLFSGDHVMGWSSTAVSPPDGNMARYLDSLRLLLARPDRLYLPGHGPAVPRPRALVRALLRHRLEREASLVARLGRGAAGLEALVEAGYPGLDPALRPAAARTVLAHLCKLREDGVAEEAGGVWRLPG